MMNFISNQYFSFPLYESSSAHTIEEGACFYQNQKDFLSHIWEQMLVLFEKEKGKKDTNHWLKSLRILYWNSKKKIVTIATPNIFTKEWLEAHFITIMEKLFCRILNELNLKVEFIVKNIPQEKQNQVEFAPKKLVEGINKDHFIIGKSNEEVISAVCYFLEFPNQISPILCMHGPKSIGKTKLIHEIYESFLQKNKYIAIMNGKKFFEEYVTAAKKKTIESFQNYLLKNQILIIDDIEYLKEKKYTQKFLLQVITKFIEENKKIIITASDIPTSLPGLSIELKTMISEGLIFSFNPFSSEEKKTILKLKVKQYKYHIPENILLFLIEKSLTIPQAENVIHKIMAEELILKRPTTFEHLEKIINSMYKKKKSFSIEEIVNKIASVNDMNAEQIKKNRSQKYIKIKYLCLYVLKKIVGIPYQEIITYFGYKDHTTLSYACAQFEEKYLHDKNNQEILSLFR